MKHRIRDIIIMFIAYSGLGWIYRCNVRRRGPLVRILCFHDVSELLWFRDVLEMLVNEFNVITPEQFHAHEFHVKKINILITFDDGYQSWVGTCLPVMEEFGVKGIFFVNSGLLDVAHDVDASKKYMREKLLLGTVRQPLTWTAAAKLVSAGQTIGGHTFSHVRATAISEENWNNEVKNDKCAIETKLNLILKNFAFPFGRYTDFDLNKIQSVQNAGYCRFFSAESSFSLTRHLVSPRLLVEEKLSLRKLRSWIYGSYDIFNYIKLILWKTFSF